MTSLPKSLASPSKGLFHQRGVEDVDTHARQVLVLGGGGFRADFCRQPVLGNVFRRNGLLQKGFDKGILSRLDDAEFARRSPVDHRTRYGEPRLRFEMLSEHDAQVHPVELVAGNDEIMRRVLRPEVDEVSCVRRRPCPRTSPNEWESVRRRESPRSRRRTYRNCRIGKCEGGGWRN